MHSPYRQREHLRRGLPWHFACRDHPAGRPSTSQHDRIGLHALDLVNDLQGNYDAVSAGANGQSTAINLAARRQTGVQYPRPVAVQRHPQGAIDCENSELVMVRSWTYAPGVVAIVSPAAAARPCRGPGGTSRKICVKQGQQFASGRGIAQLSNTPGPSRPGGIPPGITIWR
jgi:hypothetical protein